MLFLNRVLFRKLHSVIKLSINTASSVQYLKPDMSVIKSDIIYLRRLGNSEYFQAIFSLNYKPLNVTREFNFNRRVEENLEAFLGRIKTNVEKIMSRKAKRKKRDDSVNNSEDVQVSLLYDKKELPPVLTCADLFFSDGYDVQKLVLKVIDFDYKFEVNSPWVVRFTLPSSIMAGFTVYPDVDIIFGDKRHSKFSWYKRVHEKENWIEVGQGMYYTPSAEEIGCELKLVCTPSDGIKVGPEVAALASFKVDAGPGLCPFHSRHSYTKEKLPIEKFRVVSYNILANLYAETDAAKTELFAYCPAEFLCLDYRKQLYLQEIVGYNADIICLQEVDVKVFDNDLKHVLEERNLRGLLSKKGADVAEGVATFFAEDKFRLLENTTTELGCEIDVDPIFNKIWRCIKTNENLKMRFKERNSVLQTIVLESKWKPDEKIVVCNTHLYFHPDADHIRLLQAAMILANIEDFVKHLKRKFPSGSVSIIICGDFNSTPDSGIYRLMTKNYIPTDIIDWKSKKGEEVEGLELRHPFQIGSACGTPQFTNYTVGFSGCLDYIYYQKDKLNVLQFVPLPDEEELKRNEAIPSKFFPSDHVSLVADFEWKKS